MSSDTFDKRKYATALGVSADVKDLDGALFNRLADIERKARNVSDEVDERIEEILDGLRLPLHEALAVTETEVDMECRRIVEEMAALVLRNKEAWAEAEKKIDEAAAQLPEEQREEAKAYSGFATMFS